MQNQGVQPFPVLTFPETGIGGGVRERCTAWMSALTPLGPAWLRKLLFYYFLLLRLLLLLLLSGFGFSGIKLGQVM